MTEIRGTKTHNKDDTDREFAARAIDEARKSPGNTRVGAVIAREGTLLVAGHKDEVLKLHAEQVALQKANEAGIDVRGASLYVTMEPCANHRTNRVSCAELLTDAGISVVHIGEYDPNPQINRLGWKHLRDHGVQLRDFPTDLREQAHDVSSNFTRFFTHGFGMSTGAKFDFMTNGARFTISVDEEPDSPSWVTEWPNAGPSSIHFHAGVPGVVALARYAKEFDEIDDPDALDYGGTAVTIDVGSIGVMRNEHGHVLCKVAALEPIAPWGTTEHSSVTIHWEIRLADEA